MHGAVVLLWYDQARVFRLGGLLISPVRLFSCRRPDFVLIAQLRCSHARGQSQQTSGLIKNTFWSRSATAKRLKGVTQKTSPQRKQTLAIIA
jgi:hypothetical protein